MRILSLVAVVVLTLPSATPPFSVGERLSYDARMGVIPVGSAELLVAGAPRSNGVPVWKFTLEGSGGPPGVRAQWALASWTEQARFVTRRFHRLSEVRGHAKNEQFEILPDSQRYRVAGEDGAWVAPAKPLDELAMLYYLRTLDLAPGQNIALRGYFKNGWNPVMVRVLAREVVKTGNGRQVSCLRLRVSASGAQSEICLTDDARRIPAEVTVPLSFGRVTFTWDGSQ